MSILKKVIIGYICIVFVPICIFGAVIYHLFNTEVMKDYVVGKQQMLQHAYSNLRVSMTQIEGLYNVIEYDQNMIQYLSGFYDSDSERIYNYVNYIRPLLTYIRNSNPSIDSIKIYKSYTGFISFKPEIMNISEMKEEAHILPKLDFSGLWIYESRTTDKVPTLKYYQKIYDHDYVNVLGILEISMKDSMIAQFLDSAKASSSNYPCLLSKDNVMIYCSNEIHNRLSASEMNEIIGEIARNGANSNYFNMFNNRMVTNTLAIEELGIQAVMISNTKEEFGRFKDELTYTIVIIVFLLLVLSAIYYFTASSITRRILKLAKHMRKVDENNFSPYFDQAGRDEIGVLVFSYNSMIHHIDELVNTVHRSEILRKEAAYAALQAQIKPHFLYNTLESLRMMAELNQDMEVADMCYSFGRLMRYCLSKDNEHTLLQHEIINMDNYLKICKIRMGDRLNYEFDIRTNIDHVMCPKFILQPLVENSIMHGMSKSRKGSLLKVIMFEESDYLFIEIRDNGQGMNTERLKQIQDLLNNKVDPKSLQTSEGGFGICNVHERIKAYYGAGSGLFLESREGEGTTCTVKLRKQDRQAS